jgi:hypothetical protein
VCHRGAIERRWTQERVFDAMLYRARYGRLPSSYDWSRAHAGRRAITSGRLDLGEPC